MFDRKSIAVIGLGASLSRAPVTPIGQLVVSSQTKRKIMLVGLQTNEKVSFYSLIFSNLLV